MTPNLHWGTESDWTAADKTDIQVDGGVFRLAYAIPDSGLLHHYDATDSSTITESGGTVTDWGDKAGSETLTGSVSGLGAINGTQAIVFDGGSLGTSFDTSIAQTYHIFTVSESTDDGTGQTVHDARGNNAIAARRWDNNNYQWHAGSHTNGGTPTESPELWEAIAAGPSSELVSNGTTVVSGDAGTDALNGLTIGNTDSSSQSNPHNGPIGEVMVYDPSASGYSRSDVRSYLADKWGISI